MLGEGGVFQSGGQPSEFGCYMLCGSLLQLSCVPVTWAWSWSSVQQSWVVQPCRNRTLPSPHLPLNATQWPASSFPWRGSDRLLGLTAAV